MAKSEFRVKGLVDLDITPLTNSIKAAQAQLGKFGGADAKRLDNIFTNLIGQAEKFSDIARTSHFSSLSEIKAANQGYQQLADSMKKVNAIVESGNLKSNLDFSGALKKGLRVLDEYEKKGKSLQNTITDLVSGLSPERQGMIDIDELVGRAMKGGEIGSLLKSLRQSYSQTQKKETVDDIESARKDVDKLQAQIDTIKDQQKERIKNRDRDQMSLATKVGTKDKQQAQWEKNVNDYNAAIDKADKKLSELQKKLKDPLEMVTKADEKAELGKVIEDIAESFELVSQASKELDFNEIFGPELAQRLELTTGSVEDLRNVLNNLDDIEVDILAEDLRTVKQELEKSQNPIQQYGKEMGKALDQGENLQNMQTQIQSLENSMLQFFSLTNGWNLLRRAIKGAYDTVKELDDAMTEIAVVSDYHLDEIWRMREVYSQAATEMGASTIDLVDATKLYVQQGLNLEEAQQVAIETIRMARIANLDGAEATNLMTAAIRGYNMELTEANKVNDIYSQLAAKSAADTEEIAIAMSKTASIAANSGAEFANMSAFLTQVVESTREAPETAGTAMKTIIARFQELKKPMDEIGEIDGEIIDANAIETALRSAGIELRNLNGDFRDFDDVIIELSNKWDSLETMTQRYIATMAAGSRQQSRFIALVSNNARLTELLGFAQESAGAANVQFEKTLDSLESKVNKLNNAIDIFSTNLMNSDVIKGVVGIVTELVNAINSVVEVATSLPGVLGNFGGMAATLLLTIGGFKLATAAIKAMFAGIAKEFIQAKTTITGESQDMARQVEVSFERSSRGVKKSTKDTVQAISNEFNNMETKTFGGLITAFDSIPSEIKRSFSKKMVPIANQIANDVKSNLSLEGEMREAGEKAVDAFAFALRETKDVDMAMQVLKSTIAELPAEVQTQVQAALSNSQLSGDTVNIVNAHFKTFTSTIGNLGSAISSMGYELQSSGIPGLQTLGSVLVKVGGLATTVGRGVSSVISSFQLFTKSADSGTSAIQRMNAAFKASPFFWVALAIGAVIGAIYILDKLIETSNEKIQRLEQTITELGREAESAGKAIEEIGSARDSLAELEQTFEDLTKGTKEWRDALVSVNQKVLELLSTYPELAGYIDRGTHGELIVTDEGWDSLIKAQEDRMEAMVVAQAGASIQRGSTLRDNLEAPVRTTYDFSNEDIQKVTSLIVERGINIQTEAGAQEIENIFAELGIANTELYKDEGKSVTILDSFLEQTRSLGEEYLDYANDLQSMNMEIEAHKDAFITTLMSGEELADLDYGEQARGALDRTFNDLDDKISTEESEMGRIKEEQKQAYADLTGQTLDAVNAQLKNKELSKDTIKTTLATQAVNEDMIESAIDVSKAAENLPKNLADVGLASERTGRDFEEVSKAFINLASEDATKVSRGDLSAVLAAGNLGSYEDLFDEQGALIPEKLTALQADLEEMGYDILEHGYENIEQFVSHLGGAVLAFEDANAQLDRIKMSTGARKTFDALTEDLGTEAYGSFVDSLLTTFVEGGDIEAILAATSDLFLDVLPEDEMEAAMGALAKINWKSIDSIESLENALKANGIQVDDLSQSSLMELMRVLKETNHAVKEFDLTKIREQIQSNQELIENLQGRDYGDRQFTKEEMEELTAAGVDSALFVGIGDSWRYVGDSAQDMIVALQDNTKALMGDSIELMETEIAAGTLAQEHTTGINTLSDVEGMQYESVARGVLGDFISKAISQDISLDTLGIRGLSDDTKVDQLTLEEIKQIVDQLVTLGAQVDDTAIKVGQLKSEEGMTEYQGASQYKTLQDASQTVDPVKSEQAAQSILFQAAAYEETNDELLKYNKALEAYNERQSSANKETLDAARQQLSFATDVAKASRALDELDDKVLEHLKGLEVTNKETDAYRETLAQLALDLNKAFGTNITEEFLMIGDHLDLLTRSLEGDQEAWEGFLIALDIAQVQTTEFADQFGINARYIESIVNALDGISFDIEGRADMTQVFNELIAAGMTIEEAAAALEALGYSNIEFTAETQKMPVDIWKQHLNNGRGGFEPMMMNVPKAVYASKVNIPAARNASQFGSGGKGSYQPDKKKGGGKGGGGGGKEEEPWENTYDWLYNLVEKTNKAIRDRNRLESEYSRMLERRKATSKDLHDNMQAQLDNLRQQQKYLMQQQSGRLSEQAKIETDYSDVRKYANYNESLGYVEINWDELERLSGSKGSQEEGARVEEYIGKLEDIAGKLDEIDDSLYDIDDQIYALYQLGKEEYMNLEERILDALIYAHQSVIDGLSNINDSINDSNSKIIQKLQDSITESRRIRSNLEKEEEITDKENRLAYLRQDTSGGNQLEILKLEEEIAQARQDYTDTLIDDKINELQMQNDISAEQRERQILIMQTQLDNAVEQGELWDDVYLLFETGIDKMGKLVTGSQLETLLKDSERYNSLSDMGKMNWLEELEQQSALAVAYLKGLKDQGPPVAVASVDIGHSTSSSASVSVDVQQTTNTAGGGSTKASTKQTQKATQAKSSNAKTTQARASGGPGARPVKLSVYKKGGLADFTGPAWLDGTKRDPELILNAEDTRNFIALTDTLRSLGGLNKETNSFGTNYFDISIQVDELANDYDVDQLSERVKKQIVDDSLFRNINVVDLRR